MTELYRLKGKVYHDGIYLYTINLTTYFAAEPRPDETIELTWDNWKKYSTKLFNWGFHVYHFKRGRVVSFDDWGLIKSIRHKEWRDIHEKKSPLNLTVELYSVKLTLPLSEVMKYLTADEAVQYLTERGLSVK